MSGTNDRRLESVASVHTDALGARDIEEGQRGVANARNLYDRRSLMDEKRRLSWRVMIRR